MIYSCGLIEKLRLRAELKPGEKVFLLRGADPDGSYCLFITGINLASAEVQAEQWVFLHPGEMVVDVNEYDLDTNTFVQGKP
jgi:hypothetical protein